MTPEDIIMVIGCATCIHFAQMAVFRLISLTLDTITHVESHTDTPSLVVYLDGVPIGTMEDG